MDPKLPVFSKKRNIFDVSREARNVDICDRS